MILVLAFQSLSILCLDFSLVELDLTDSAPQRHRTAHPLRRCRWTIHKKLKSGPRDSGDESWRNGVSTSTSRL